MAGSERISTRDAGRGSFLSDCSWRGSHSVTTTSSASLAWSADRSRLSTETRNRRAKPPPPYPSFRPAMTTLRNGSRAHGLRLSICGASSGNDPHLSRSRRCISLCRRTRCSGRPGCVGIATISCHSAAGTHTTGRASRKSVVLASCDANVCVLVGGMPATHKMLSTSTCWCRAGAELLDCLMDFPPSHPLVHKVCGNSKVDCECQCFVAPHTPGEVVLGDAQGDQRGRW